MKYTEMRKALEDAPGGDAEWIIDCTGENLGTGAAVITGYFIRRRTDEEKAQRQRDMAALVEADLNSRTPLFGGRS